MKRLYPGFALFFLLASCKKNEFAAPQSGPAVASISQFAPASAPVATPWERPVNWLRTAEADGSVRFSATRAIAGLNTDMLENGAVLTYTKGYNLQAPAVEKPIGLPFQFLSISGRSDAALEWDVVRQTGALTLTVNVPAEDARRFESGNANIQVRHILLSPSELAATGRTAMELRNMTYKAVTDLLRIAP